jgi:hypothetical protein
VLGLLILLLLVPFAGELLVSLSRPIFYTRTLIWTSLPFLETISKRTEAWYYPQHFSSSMGGADATPPDQTKRPADDLACAR